jgi:hypothetical protein
MKKSILIAGLFVLYASIGSAQDNEVKTDSREKFQFGIKAGLNYSNVYDAKGEEFNADAKFGWVGGALIAIPLGRLFGIQPEILISEKGFKATGKILGSSYSFTRTTTYIDIPLQIALKPTEFITILAGPQFSYLIKQKDVFAVGANSVAQEKEFVNDNIRKNIFGVVGGIDINLSHFTIGARAGWDVQNNNGNGTTTTPRYKNVWYQATIGYKFYN